MARTPESAAVDFAESSLFTGRFSILALAACGVGFSLSGRLPAAIFSLAAAAVAAAARLWARHVLDGVNAALQAERSCVFPGEPCPLRVTLDNPKWLPLVWLTVRFPLEPGGALRPEHRWETVELPEGGVQKPYYEKNVSFLLGHQRMSYTSRLQAEHRGLLSFDRIRLPGRSPGLAESSCPECTPRRCRCPVRLLPCPGCPGGRCTAPGPQRRPGRPRSIASSSFRSPSSQFPHVGSRGFQHQLLFAHGVKGHFRQGVAAHGPDREHHALPEGGVLHHVPLL